VCEFYFQEVDLFSRQTLPLRVSINFYERYIRAAIPWLPSIWGTLQILFPEGIKLPTFTSITAGPYKGAGPIGHLPTLNVDLDAVINAGQGQVNGGGGAANGDAPSEVTSIRSKLEAALKRVVTFPPGNLNQGLADIKVQQLHGPLLSH
jgi:hypothetical protein